MSKLTSDCPARHTIRANVKLDDASDANIDNAEKSLVLLLEFLLIKDLYGQNTVLRRLPNIPLAIACAHVKLLCVQVEALVPIRIQSLLDDAGSLGLLPINCGNGERVGETCRSGVK